MNMTIHPSFFQGQIAMERTTVEMPVFKYGGKNFAVSGPYDNLNEMEKDILKEYATLINSGEYGIMKVFTYASIGEVEPDRYVTQFYKQQ